MMALRISLGAALLMALFAGTGGAQQSGARQSSADAEQEIKALMEQVRVAALKSDVTFFDGYLAADVSRIDAGGRLASKNEMISNFKSGQMKYRSLTVQDLKVRIYGDTAVVIVIYDSQGTNRGHDFSQINRATRVLVKRDGKWQEVAFQATKVQ